MLIFKYGGNWHFCNDHDYVAMSIWYKERRKSRKERVFNRRTTNELLTTYENIQYVLRRILIVRIMANV